MAQNEPTINSSIPSTNILLTKKFGIKDKIGYLFGDFANDFFFGFAGSYLMVFYTDVLGIGAAFVGVIFMIARFWDALADVTVGRFIDFTPNY